MKAGNRLLLDPSALVDVLWGVELWGVESIAGRLEDADRRITILDLGDRRNFDH